jgi:hypothetical protein
MENIKMGKNNIISVVQEAIESDDEPQTKQNRLICKAYYNANEDQRKVVDEIFTSLCGWRLKTIIEEL